MRALSTVAFLTDIVTVVLVTRFPRSFRDPRPFPSLQFGLSWATSLTGTPCLSWQWLSSPQSPIHRIYTWTRPLQCPKRHLPTCSKNYSDRQAKKLSMNFHCFHNNYIGVRSLVQSNTMNKTLKFVMIGSTRAETSCWTHNPGLPSCYSWWSTSVSIFKS